MLVWRRPTTRHALAVCGVPVAAALVLAIGGPNPVLRSLLGLDGASAAPLARSVTVTVGPRDGVVTARVTVIAAGGTVSWLNRLTRPVVLRAAKGSPAAFEVTIPAAGQATLTLAHPGLYHYYDVATGRPLRFVAGNEVITARSPRVLPRQGWIAVLAGLPGLKASLTIPSGQDLFEPKVIVSVVGGTIDVANHDSDPHNFLVDPASPAGAAFIVYGASDEPPRGWSRALVVQQPGLYHVYCAMHTRVSGNAGGWQVLTPRASASGYHDRNPMEAWIVVLPANVAL